MPTMSRKPQQPPPISSRISSDTAAKAADAILKWIRSQPKHQKAQLLEHDEVIHLVVTMCKIPPKARTNPYYIPLPHPIHSLRDAAVCLFVDDRSKSPVQPSDAEARIRSESIPVTDVISLGSLKTDYIPYESRRKLCASYDLFFADRRIIHLLPRLIGKQFFKKKKHPLPIDLSHKNWTAQLMKGCGSALLYMRTGTCCQLNIGRLSMGRDEIADNIIAAVEGAVEKIPKGWANIRSVLVKSDESIGLPIYQALPEMGLKIEVFPKGEGSVLNSEENADPDHISDNTTVDQVLEEVTKVGSARKSVLKKGKLHKVRYMDTNLDGENVMFDFSGNNKSDDGDHSLGGDNDHYLGSGDSESHIEKRKHEKKRKQRAKANKGSSNIRSFPEADELTGEESQGKKKNKGKKKLKIQQVEEGNAREEPEELIGEKSQGNKKKGGKKLKTRQVENEIPDEELEELIGEKSQCKEEEWKKLKTQQVEDGTADKDPEKLIGKMSQGKKKGDGKKLKTQQVDDGTAYEKPEKLIGKMSQGKKKGEAKKLNTQQVEDGTVDEEPRGGIAKKANRNVNNISEIDSHSGDGGSVIKQSTGRKKSERKKKRKTTIPPDNAKSMKDKTKNFQNKEGTEKKTKAYL